VLIFTADHGEYFLERGRFFHGKDVYDALLHVPLLISGAVGKELRGRVVSQTVEIRSIPATVLGMLGVPADGFGGRDLLEVARGGHEEPSFAEGSYAFGTDRRTRAVVRDGWKLIQRLDDDGYELYELAADPHERDDRYGAEMHGDKVAQLRLLLADFVRLPRLEPQAVGLSPEEIERLKALGYVR
jgi:arylsulfatase A-like enzyme